MSQHYQHRKKANERYLQKFDEVRIRLPKEDGLKATVQKHAESRGESVQAFIIRAILETIKRDTETNYIDGRPDLEY